MKSKVNNLPPAKSGFCALNQALSPLLLLLLAVVPGHALTGDVVNPAHQSIVDGYAADAVAEDPGFRNFSEVRGRDLFQSLSSTGKPDTPSCTTCHTSSPYNTGETRAGKEIEPMALSVSPDRYSDLKKVEKWFGRNCRSVLGRNCSAIEKGDFLSYMINQ